MKVIGLTGGIGSGKSTITSYLLGKGLPVIDADKLSRDIVAPGSEGLEKIALHFGSAYLMPDGQLDRAKMGAAVFSDSAKLGLLNSLLHPILRLEIQKKINQYRVMQYPLIFLDAAILIEAGMQDLVDEIWLIYATPENQIQRIMQRDHFNRQQALDRIKSQMPIEEKKQYADRIIDNNGTREKTIEQVAVLLAKENHE